MEINYKNYLISDDKSLIQPNRVHELLSVTYWAKGRTMETVEKSIETSLCFGIYSGEKQVGFARCVTDYATIYWLADVIVDDSCRGEGLGKALVGVIVEHEKLKTLDCILSTSDAHGLYAQNGFFPVDGRFMRRTGARDGASSIVG